MTASRAAPLTAGRNALGPVAEAEPSREEPVVFLQDRFLSTDESPVVSLFDRGYLHGDAVFETVRTYGGRFFRLAAHLDRLLLGAGTLGIEPPLTMGEMVAVADEAATRTARDSAHVRITLSRGAGGSGVSTAGCRRPVLSIVARPLAGYPHRAYRHGIATSVVSARRIPSACVPSSFKSANYLPGILARRELDGRGQIEGVVLSVDGELVSGTVSNLFLVLGGEVLTPWLASSCLPGVTRAAVLELCRRVGLAAREQQLDPHLLHEADEVFFTSSLMHLLPVRSVDGRAVPAVPGPVTRALDVALTETINDEVAR